MKINFTNHDFFKEDNKLRLKKIAKDGTIFATALIMLGILLSSPTSDKSTLGNRFVQSSIEVTKDSINDLHIILNDDDCSDAFFEEVCEYLRKDGIDFEVTSRGININQSGSTIITLDQLYSSGSSTLIFSPYNNTRLGDSDSLTLAMQSAFQQNGFFADEIISGKIGFRQDDNGNVSGLVPTETEEQIDEDSDASFVTISFGTHNVNAEWVAKSIESGLARQKYYLDNYDSNTDLLYRAEAGEDIKVVADYFGTSTHDLTKFNHLQSTESLESQIIVNPNVDEIKAFQKDEVFTIDGEKTKTY